MTAPLHGPDKQEKNRSWTSQNGRVEERTQKNVKPGGAPVQKRQREQKTRRYTTALTKRGNQARVQKQKRLFKAKNARLRSQKKTKKTPKARGDGPSTEALGRKGVGTGNHTRTEQDSVKKEKGQKSNLGKTKNSQVHLGWLGKL